MSYTPRECADKLSILLRGRSNRALDFTPFHVKSEFFHGKPVDVVDRVSKAWFSWPNPERSCVLSTEDLNAPACNPMDGQTLHPVL